MPPKLVRIKEIDNHRLQGALQAGKVVVVAGFQGVDEEGNTPLYVFVSEGNKNVVENLLTYGAKVDIPNKDDEMPLTVAIRNKRVDIIKLLLFEGTELAVSEDELKILKNILPFDLFENFFGRELISQNLLILLLV